MSAPTPIEFRLAEPKHAATVAALVFELTNEIIERTQAQDFDLELATLTRQCRDFLERGIYQAWLVYRGEQAVGVATLAETFALYAGGKIGVVQEFYVVPEYRSNGLGAGLMERVFALGAKRGWACVELCTPPLPEFEGALRFYQQHGFQAVGGRKMRVNTPND
jgi:GNAT superfamily N-acetyltransferase